MSTPKYTFLMPAYKARYIRESIQSILDQTYPNFELIIVDDKSPEDIKSIVDEYDDPRVTYHRNEENIGSRDLVAQWNHCLTFAHGDYVIMATDDDTYDPAFLSEADRCLTAHPEVDLFRGRIVYVHDDGSIFSEGACFPDYMSEVEFWYEMFHSIGGGVPQYVYKLRALRNNDVHGFVPLPKAWGSDDVTALLQSKHGVVASAQPLVNFRFSDISISGGHSDVAIKVKARLLQYQWMAQHLPDLSGLSLQWQKFYDTEIHQALHKHCVGAVGTELRSTNIHTWWGANRVMLHSYLSGKDKCILLWRGIVKFFIR